MRLFRLQRVLLTVCCAAILSGCGGGGSSSSSPTAPPPVMGSFHLTPSPTQLGLFPGQSQPADVGVTSDGGFLGTVTITLSGLPAGVTVTPTSAQVAVSGTANFTITAAANAAIGTAQIQFNGVSGSLQSSNTITLIVNALATPISRPFVTVGGGLERGFVDESRHLLYASNLALNEIDVISTVDLGIQARVPVPQPLGIDQMPDGKTLVIGTFTQGIYTFDEDTFAVTQHLAPNLLDSFNLKTTVELIMPVAMANGKVLIIGKDAGIFSGFAKAGQQIIKWDSQADVFTQVSLPGTTPGQPMEFPNLKRSQDHKWAMTGQGQLFIYSSDSDSFITKFTVPAGTLEDFAVDPSGTKFAAVTPQAVTLYDRNLNLLGSVQTNTGVFAYLSAQFSQDGSRLFWLLLGEQSGGAVEDVIDVNNLKELGGVSVAYGSVNQFLIPLWVDSSNRAFIAGAGGIGALDCNVLRSGPPTIASDAFPVPSGAVLNTPISVKFDTPGIPVGTAITFGGQLAQFVSMGPSNNPLVVTAPASATAGPIDLVLTFPDGETIVEPQSFSYGVDVLAASATLAAPTGNPQVVISGFGIVDSSRTAPSVSVSGQSAPSVSLIQLLPSVNVLQQIAITLPNSSPGQKDIVITNNLGTGTLKNAIEYIPSASIIPAGNLRQLLFDTHRNVLYALRSNEIDVLDPNTLNWETPIHPNGTATPGFVSMALTPDGSKLLIVDGANSNLTIFSPDNAFTSTVTTLPGTSAGLAVTNTGKAFITSSPMPIEFDLTTQTFKLRGNFEFDSLPQFAATPDGSHLVVASLSISDGQLGVWDSSTDQFTFQDITDYFWSDVAISPDGSKFAAIESASDFLGAVINFYDPQLHFLNTTVYPDLAQPTGVPALGAMFSSSGKTLLLPSADSIDFYDPTTGLLLGRVLTPEKIPDVGLPNITGGAIALNPGEDTIYAISVSGLTVLKLPTPADQVVPPKWPFSARSNKTPADLRAGLSALKSLRIAKGHK